MERLGLKFLGRLTIIR